MLYRVVNELERNSGLPEDRFLTTFHFNCASDADAVNAMLAVRDFYGDSQTNLGSCVFNGDLAHTLKLYKVTIGDPGAGDDVTGSPISSVQYSTPVRAATCLPTEVSVAVSYHALLTDVPEEVPAPGQEPPVIRPASRRRGRFYYGPLAVAWAATDPNGEPEPATALREGILLNLVPLLAGDGALWQWCVYSREDGAVYNVVGAWIDNAFDTLRSRGKAPTSRVSS